MTFRSEKEKEQYKLSLLLNEQEKIEYIQRLLKEHEAIYESPCNITPIGHHGVCIDHDLVLQAIKRQIEREETKLDNIRFELENL